MFRIYRTLDFFLIFYFAFWFATTNAFIDPVIARPLGWLIAGLMTWRLIKSLWFVSGALSKDSVLFDLKDCTHHHGTIQGGAPR